MRADVNALTLKQTGFVPRGDLVVDYRSADGDAELRAWTYTGGFAVAPDAKLAEKKNVGIDQKVVDAQRAIAADPRPTAVIALRPKLPRWREAKTRDYTIVIDSSQSMVGERYTRSTELATRLIEQMDRRDRFTVMACDSECREFGAPAHAVDRECERSRRLPQGQAGRRRERRGRGDPPRRWQDGGRSESRALGHLCR